MYKIDLTHPDYFHQMKKVELQEKTKYYKNSVNKKYNFALSVVVLLTFYFTALFGIVYYFSNQ